MLLPSIPPGQSMSAEQTKDDCLPSFLLSVE